MTVTLILLVLSATVFGSVALAVLVRADRQRRRHLARLRRVRPEPSFQTAEPNRKITERPAENSLTARIERHLAQTNLRVSVTELLVQVSLGAFALFALLVLLFGMFPPLGLALALGLPLGTAVLVIRIAKARYQAAFTESLPEALDVFARGLRAGRPVSDSLSVVVATAKGPIQREFARCRDEISMGSSLHKSLARLEQRMPTAEVSFFAVATSLQAETGGNLIETMEGLAGQLRERRKLRKKARALSSEARASAVILAALPFAVGLAMAVLNAAYLEPLYADPRGRIMSVIALTSIGLGVFVMQRMGKLDV